MRPWFPAVLVLALACSATRPVSIPVPEDQPGEADEYYAAKRAGSDDPQRSYAIAREQIERMRPYSTEGEWAGRGAIVANGTLQPWKFLGPGNIGGRTRTLVFDPNNPEIMYAGGVSGGVWKTTDGGGRWTAVGDEMANLAVNSLAIDRNNPNVLYAGTGEGYFREEVRGTGLPLRGNGIFVTHDAGASWSRLESTSGNDFLWVNDLAISAHDSSRIYAATRTGVWRSTDAGAQWTRVVATTVKGGCLDLVARPGANGDYLFASCGTLERATVYRATNAETSAAWSPVLSVPHQGRTTLAIAPSNPSIIYALSASNEPGLFNQSLLGVYRSVQDGDSGSWQARVTNTTADRTAAMMLSNPVYGTFSICNQQEDQIIPMGWYCNAIAVDPTNPDRLFAAGVDLYRSDDGGLTWGLASYWWTGRLSYLHADQHSIVFHPRYNGNTNKTVFFTNDGGVAYTSDALASPAPPPIGVCNSSRSDFRFESLSHSYGVTQFYHGAVFPDGRRFIAGAQDNGTLLGTIDDGPNAWQRVAGGDGGYVAIDPTDPSYVYAESQNAGFLRSTNGGEQFANARSGLENDTYLFVTPFALDPSHTTRLWIGGTRLWRTDDRASNWGPASTTLNGRVSAIAIAPTDSERVIAGTNTGDVVRTTSPTTATGNTQWTASSPRSGFVSSLAFDPSNLDVIYATYAGFGGAHVWKSTNGGATWTSRDGSGDGALPDIPVHSIAVDPTRPERLYLGTDLGVFVSTDGGEHWLVENTGFAAAVTETVVIAPGANGPAVYAFTHGRGAWRSELVAPGPRRRGVRK